MKLFKVIAPMLALIGVPMSIWCLGEYGDLWCLLFCWFCIFILFWWYLANIVFRPASKKERRNLAFKRVTGKKKKAAAEDEPVSKQHSFRITHERKIINEKH